MALSKSEKWCPVNEFPNYQISDQGRVKSNITGQILRPRNCRGYNRVTMYKDGHRSDKFIHRLVGETFIDNPLNKKEINHIDGDKLNNSVMNLEWCTRSENIKHAFTTNLKYPSGGLPNKKLKVVETGNIYESAYECAKNMNLDQAHINHCLVGQRKSHKGYHFEYV